MMNNNSLDLSRFPQLNFIPRLLLGPGPSLADPRVLQAMTTPLIGHLDPDFLDLMDRVQVLLRYVFETENKLTTAVPGTGTAAMEAAVANMVEPGDQVLVCVNGYFSLRIAEMARRYGAEVETIERRWGEVFTADDVRLALARRPAKVVAIVHAETSTGALQPLDQIANVVHEAGALLLVDAVTSLGGVPVRVDEVGIDVCYSGAQKCLGCPPGSSPITLGPRALDALQARKTKVTNYYLDLNLIIEYWGAKRAYHHTAPISNVFALYEGLRIVAEEGLQARFQRHRENAQLLWDGLQEMGLSLHIPREHRLPTLTTVVVPEGVNEAEVRRRLLDEYHIEIGGGLGELKGKVWRIGLMGFSSRPENVVVLLGALQRLLR